MKSILFLLLFTAQIPALAQPGKYAGTKKSLVGRVHMPNDNLKELKGWTLYEGAVMNTNVMTDPELHLVSVYQKGTTRLIIFSVIEDTASERRKIVDVAEVTGVAKGWIIKAYSCRQNKVPNGYIVAWGKESEVERIKIIKKAWRLNPDKRRIEVIPVKNIDCEPEEGC